MIPITVTNSPNSGFLPKLETPTSSSQKTNNDPQSMTQYIKNQNAKKIQLLNDEHFRIKNLDSWLESKNKKTKQQMTYLEETSTYKKLSCFSKPPSEFATMKYLPQKRSGSITMGMMTPV